MFSYSKHFLYWISLLYLTACTLSQPLTHLPKLSQGQVKWYQLEQLNSNNSVKQTYLLTIQAENNLRSRWIQTDMFGVPHARFIATPEGWQRDGFIAPNRQVEKLFTQLIPFINQNFHTPITIDNWQITPLE